MLKFKTSKQAGDLIAFLSAIKNVCEIRGDKAVILQRLNLPIFIPPGVDHPLVDTDGNHVAMDDKMFEMLWPLLLNQDYIGGARIWEGDAFDINLDAHMEQNTRNFAFTDIHYWPSFHAPELVPNYSKPWIKVSSSSNKFNELVISDSIIISRTGRYNNPHITYFFLRKHEDKLIFTGTVAEHKAFCSAWGLSIPRLVVDDFFQLAQAFKSCRFLLSNQTFAWHLADAMQIPRILEVCVDYPNTFPTSKSGVAFVNQGALEYYFDSFFEKSS